MRYEFVLEERLSTTTLRAIPELHESTNVEMPGSALTGTVRDGAHLNGLLDRFEALGLTLVKMTRLPD